MSASHIAKFKKFEAMFEEAGFRLFQGSLDAQDFE